MVNAKYCLIINPASAGGKTRLMVGTVLNHYRNSFGYDAQYFLTGTPKEATEIAFKIAESGCEVIIAAGGDGTIHEVINGLFCGGKLSNPNLKLGIISIGTGQGFAQSLGLPKTIKEQFEIIKNGEFISVDVGKIKLEHAEQYFINEFQLGIGGEVVRSVNGKSKKLGGKIAFGFGTIKTVLKYPNQCMRLLIDDEIEMTGKFLGIVIANGEFTGGGMRLTPNASVNDGELNVLIMKEQSIRDRLITFKNIYSGKHIRNKNFEYIKAKRISIKSSEVIPAEADGEIINEPPSVVEILPSALKVITKNVR